MIILDFGSGNTCKNDKAYVKKMIDGLVHVDSRDKEVVIKWQLFLQAGDNVPLEPAVFDYAYHYAKELGYATTASVFDTESLKLLLGYDVPFIKIANRPDLWWLANEQSDVPVLVSGQDMYCVSEYPATVEQYEALGLYSGCNISDHTTDFTLYHKYRPKVIEFHYKLPDSTGLDAGPFAKTPEVLKEIL